MTNKRADKVHVESRTLGSRDTSRADARLTAAAGRSLGDHVTPPPPRGKLYSNDGHPRRTLEFTVRSRRLGSSVQLLKPGSNAPRKRDRSGETDQFSAFSGRPHGKAGMARHLAFAICGHVRRHRACILGRLCAGSGTVGLGVQLWIRPDKTRLPLSPAMRETTDQSLKEPQPWARSYLITCSYVAGSLRGRGCRGNRSGDQALSLVV